MESSHQNVFQLWGHLYSALSWSNFPHPLLASHCSVPVGLTSIVQQQHLQMSKTFQNHFSLLQETSPNTNTALNSNHIQPQCFCGTIGQVFFVCFFFLKSVFSTLEFKILKITYTLSAMAWNTRQRNRKLNKILIFLQSHLQSASRIDFNSVLTYIETKTQTCI